MTVATAPTPAAPEAAPPQLEQPVPAISAVPPPVPGTLEDLSCIVEVHVGTGTVTVAECLGLTPGTLLALDQAAGEDLKVRANGVLVAAGEVVIEEDNSMIRVTEVAPSDHTL